MDQAEKTTPSAEAEQKESERRRRADTHKLLLARYPKPWTRENLGTEAYMIVAKNGEFFDPITQRPGYFPSLHPIEDEPDMEILDIVKVAKDLNP